jgi:hypothetical protein
LTRGDHRVRKVFRWFSARSEREQQRIGFASFQWDQNSGHQTIPGYKADISKIRREQMTGSKSLTQLFTRRFLVAFAALKSAALQTFSVGVENSVQPELD